MAYIELGNNLQGIRGLLKYNPVTAYPLLLLAETLLQGNSTLSKGERELIATYTSFKNDCQFCQLSHGGAAATHLGLNLDAITEIKSNPDNSELITPKMKTLLHIAALVQQGGKFVTDNAIQSAKNYGATDAEIHDTVLIAAAFCLFNRYVDGLGTNSESNPESYLEASARMANEGYLRKENLAMMGINPDKSNSL